MGPVPSPNGTAERGLPRRGRPPRSSATSGASSGRDREPASYCPTVAGVTPTASAISFLSCLQDDAPGSAEPDRSLAPLPPAFTDEATRAASSRTRARRICSDLVIVGQRSGRRLFARRASLLTFSAGERAEDGMSQRRLVEATRPDAAGLVGPGQTGDRERPTVRRVASRAAGRDNSSTCFHCRLPSAGRDAVAAIG